LAFFGLNHKPSKFFRSLVCLFRAATIAEVLVKQRINLIHAHFMTAPGDTALYLSKLTAIPFGGTAHAMDIYTDNSGLKGKIIQSSYLTTCTKANEDYLGELMGPLFSRIHKIYHGINLPDGIKTKADGQPFKFLAVGRLVPKKGFSYLIEACKILQGQKLIFRCTIIGTGPLLDSLKEKVNEAELDDVIEFKGYIAPNEMAEEYRQSDILVVPSTIDPFGDRDGLPNVCLEAMSIGVPVIGSNISGIPEGVIPGKTGWLVPPADTRALANAMKEAMQENRIDSYSKNARNFVKNNFNLETNIIALRQIMELYALRN
jgi:glycosyltransferase involved in cell wall biosynthesis